MPLQLSFHQYRPHEEGEPNLSDWGFRQQIRAGCMAACEEAIPRLRVPALALSSVEGSPRPLCAPAREGPVVDLPPPSVTHARSRNRLGELPPIESLEDFVKSRQGGRHSKKLQMQGARILRNEAYIEVRCNDER